jgi:PAS domain S-box-containing protein
VQSTVLIVDDDRALAESLAEVIGVLGLEAAFVLTGRDALIRAERGAIAVAIVDVRLPDASGLDLVRGIQERSPFAQVVVVTGDTAVEPAIAAVKGGAFAYLIKPFATETLVETVRQGVAKAGLLREQARLREALLLSERRHREVVDAVPCFVTALDPRGKIVLWNRRLEETTGYTRGEMIGRDGRTLVEGEGPQPLPMRSGQECLVRWERAQVDLDRDDAMTYAVGIDVTYEQQMLRRMLRAERLAAVGTLAAGLAHEIRNPLNAASLQLELLLRRIEKGQLESDAIKSVATVIRSEIKRLEHLLNDFLSFARPNPLNLASTQIADVVDAVLSLVAPEIEAAHVSVTCDLAPEMAPIEGDAERLKQVFLNLVRNAIEAMPEGGELALRARPQEGGVEVDVEDTGLGIADEAVIFDAFYTTKPHGTGLGLALVHRIVSDHGGQVTLRSGRGKTCFTVSLPGIPDRRSSRPGSPTEGHLEKRVKGERKRP